MAMSFARPEPSSPASVADAAFSTGRRGYDQTEVRDFLRMVAAELGRLRERERFLERELRTAQTDPDLNSVMLDDQTLIRMLGEETTRVLNTARESAAEIRRNAEESAAQLVSDASDEAARVREEAEVESSRRRSDAAADAEAELSMAKQQGREMVNEARAYRERVLSELSRRRELAREQIEQLLHGRDRLIKTFESARLAAVDVIAELQPLGEPDEYVNLAPTTGPVPVMVPNSPRPTSGDDEVVADETEPDESESNADEADEAEEIDADEVDDAEVIDEAVEVDDVVVEIEDAAEADDPIEVVEAPERDDVVVDLFARLRADTVQSEQFDEPEAEAESESGPEAEPEPETELEAEPEPEPEPEVDDTAAIEPLSGEVTPFDQRDADLTPLIVASAKKIKRVLADEQNEVLDALRRQDPVTHVDALLPPPAEHLERYRAAIVDDLLAAAHAGASSVVSGRVARLSKADVGSATALAEAVLAEWLILPLRERLDRCVADGGGDNSEVTKRVRAVYREWKTQHIDEQLDDVILTAHGRGAFAAIEPGTTVMWTSDQSRSVCSDCDDNTLSGAVQIGDAFPTGHVRAPAHLGCRCLLVPAER